MSISEPELRDHLAVLLAGRAAEKLIYDETTVGAENDLERATGMARRMVMNWGMSERLGPVSYKLSDEDPVPRPRNPPAAAVQRAHDGADRRRSRPHPPRAIEPAPNLLTRQRQKLEDLAQRLLEKEELDEHEIETVLGKSVHHKQNGQPDRNLAVRRQSRRGVAGGDLRPSRKRTMK